MMPQPDLVQDRVDPPFARLGIVGLGLIGGSVALGARAAWPSMTIVGLDTAGRAAEAARRGILTEHVSSLEAIADLDFILLAVPIEAMPEVLHALGALETRAVVTDVGSTKRRVMAIARDCGVGCFVGGHPMAGAERSGLDHARANLFHGRPWLLVDGRGPQDALARVQAFVEGLGATPQWTDAESHDRTVAYVSHLPQLIATALMNVAAAEVGDGGVSMAGPAFSEMTRLASSPPELWQGILRDNADYIAEALGQFIGQLPDGSSLIDATWVRTTFERAAEARGRWLATQTGLIGPHS
ncbi:MAG: prephenate dehydrogenase/arogenate dehydrogenase family protein [Vicinamibacterales bacterium]